MSENSNVIQLESGTCFTDNPIIFSYGVPTPNTNNYSFLKAKFIVYCRLQGSDYTFSEFSRSANAGDVVYIDVSSSLKSAVESYEYDINKIIEGNSRMPYIEFFVGARTEWLSDGIIQSSNYVYTPVAPVFDADGNLVSIEKAYRCLIGGFSDYERICANSESKKVLDMCRKPSDTKKLGIRDPQIMRIGDTVAYTPYLVCKEGGKQTRLEGWGLIDSYGDESNSPLQGQENCVYNVTSEGFNEIGDFYAYVLPELKDGRTHWQFCFVNGLGAIDYFCCDSVETSSYEVERKETILSRQETFACFSRRLIEHNYEIKTYKLSTGPLSKAWLDWFMFDFVQSKNKWTLINEHWIRCSINIDDNVKIIEQDKQNITEILFDVQLDLYGHWNKDAMIL